MAYIIGQNIQRMFHVLEQLPFNTSETELDYYHHKVSVRFTLRAVGQLETWVRGKVGNFKKIPEMLVIEGVC